MRGKLGVSHEIIYFYRENLDFHKENHFSFKFHLFIFSYLELVLFF